MNKRRLAIVIALVLVTLTAAGVVAAYVNDPPSGTYEPTVVGLEPYNGNTITVDQPRLAVGVSDPNFPDGDSVDVTWYLDGRKVGESNGVTSDQTVSHYVQNALTEGKHEWYFVLEDSNGATYTSSTTTFYVDHNDPEVYYTSTTDYTPWGGDTIYTNTPELRVDMFDDDYARNGDTVDLYYYVDGNLAHSKTGINQEGSYAFESGPLSEGKHTWYVKAVDAYGGETIASQNTFYVDHNDPYFVSAEQSPEGETLKTETPTLEHLIGDDDFTQYDDGDSLDVGWYIDGSLVHTTTGLDAGDLNDNGNIPIQYETGTLEDGRHDWHIKVTDQYGGTTTSPDYSFTIDHNDPVVDRGSAYPQNGEEFADSNVQLSVDVSDADFAGDGDTLSAGWYVDGNLVNEQTGINSNGTISYTTSDLPDGTHTWSVNVTDSYGGYDDPTETWDFTVKHAPPSLSDPSIDGVTHYETNTLGIDVTDDDFGNDGDTVVVGFYVDGSKVNEQTITSPQRVTYDVGPYADGNYDWHVEAADDYGYTTVSDTYSLDIQHDKPDVSNLLPTGTTRYSSNTLKADLADADFGRDGESLDVAFYVDGAKVNEQTVTSNGTVSYTTAELAEGSHDWHIEVADDYGYKTISDTQSLFVAHESPTATNPSIDGTTYYATNTLAVDVDDPDFGRDGDEVEAVIYVDGTAVHTETITSAERVSYDVGPYVDGNYNWHVELADSYGYTTSTPTYDLNIKHDTPEITNPSLDGVTHYENNTLSVDLADRDFQFDGDSVDVEFYVNDTLVDSQEVTANGTVSYDAGPYDDGPYTWHVEASDDYNNDVTTQTWDMIVDHDPPTVDESVAGPPNGTVSNYENVELSIGVDDADFGRDGDTVDIVWYINDNPVSVSTVIENGTYTYTTSALGDGNYTWRVAMYDDYGYVRNSTTRDFRVKHYPSQFDNATVSPTGTITTQTPTFSIDVTDPDFPVDGDSVDVGLYVNESQGGEPYLVGVDTLYQNRTAEITPTEAISGNATYWFRAVDDYGYDVNSTKTFIEAPNSLYLHGAVEPHPLLNGTAFEATLTGSNETAGFDTGTDGSVEFGDFPKGESYVFTITPNGYYQRGVFIEDLYARSVIFLINDSADVVANRVVVDDSTGEFDENAIVELETVINTTRVDNMPDNGPQWVTVGGDRLGLSGTTDVTLREGARYRFTVSNREGFSRTLGYYTARLDGTVELDIGDIAYPAPEAKGYTWTAYTNNSESGPSVTFAYNDPQELTDNITVTMTTRQTGKVIGTKTLQAGTFGEGVVTFPINKTVYETQDIRVTWEVSRDGETITGSRVVSGQSYDQAVPLGPMWQKVMYAGLMLVFAFLGGMFLGVPGLFVLLGLSAGGAAFLGVAPAALGFGVAILLTAFGATMQRWQNKSVQPQ